LKSLEEKGNMKRTERLFALIFLACFIFVGQISAQITPGQFVTPGPPTTVLVVNSEVPNCSAGDSGQKTYTSIQSAIDAVGNNSIINVCPGVYAEQLRIIEKSVTIQGVDSDGNRKVVIRPIGNLSKVETQVFFQHKSKSGWYVGDIDVFSQVAIVLVFNSVNTRLYNLTIDGSGVDYTGNVNNRDFFGIFYRNSWGSIDRTSVQNTFDNTADVDPDAAGIQPPNFREFSAAIGYINYLTNAQLNVVPASSRYHILTDNTVDNFAVNAMLLYNGDISVSNNSLSPSTSAMILKNSITGRGIVDAKIPGARQEHGIYIFGVQATVSFNEISDILTKQCVAQSAVTSFPFNPVTTEVPDKAFGSQSDSCSSYGISAYQASAGTVFKSNNIQKVDFGIFSVLSNNVLFDANIIRNAQANGIMVHGGDGNTINRNRIYKAKRVGIAVRGNNNSIGNVAGQGNLVNDADIGISVVPTVYGGTNNVHALENRLHNVRVSVRDK
jgi:hypothetical protein